MIGADIEKDVAYFASEVQKWRKMHDKELKRTLELSSGLCDMLFAFTCFEQHGIEQYPEDMQKRLREMRQKAAEAYVGHELPPIPNVKDGIDLSDLRSSPFSEKYFKGVE